MTIIPLRHIDTKDNDDNQVLDHDDDSYWHKGWGKSLNYRVTHSHYHCTALYPVQWWWWRWQRKQWWWTSRWQWWVGDSKGPINMLCSYFHGCHSTIENWQRLKQILTTTRRVKNLHWWCKIYKNVGVLFFSNSPYSEGGNNGCVWHRMYNDVQTAYIHVSKWNIPCKCITYVGSLLSFLLCRAGGLVSELVGAPW